MSRSTRALGRWELLGWINDFLCLDQGKVEELSDGTAFCQLVDAVHPGKVPLHKLVWSARTQSERIKNLNVLEKAMRECGMNKSVSAEKIAGGSFPENLALLQFLHAYIQRNAPGAHLQHDPVQRRLEAMGHTASARNRNAEDRRELLHDAAWTLHEASGNATTSSPARSLKPSLVQPIYISMPPSRSASRSAAPRYAGMIMDSDDEEEGVKSEEAERDAEWDDERALEWCHIKDAHSQKTRAWAEQAGAGRGASPGVVEAEAGDLEEVKKLQRLLEADLSSRLLAVTARSEEIREMQEERDWYLRKLHSIQAVAEAYDCYSAKQVREITLAALSCMDIRAR